MFTVRQFRRIALAALASFAFSQAAIAAMGCATLRADTARGNVAVMPSGEPCEMMGGAPASITLKHCTQTVDAAPGDPSSHHLDAFALTSLQPPCGPIAVAVPGRTLRAACILGPPPFELTQRLRI